MRAVAGQCAVDRSDPGQEAGQAGARADRGAALSVVGDAQAQVAVTGGDVDGGCRGVGVFRGVGEEFGGAEVGDGLDGRGGAGADVGGEGDGEGAVGGEGGEGGVQTLVEYGRMDALDEVAEVGDGLGGVALCGVYDGEDAVGFGAAW